GGGAASLSVRPARHPRVGAPRGRLPARAGSVAGGTLALARTTRGVLGVSMRLGTIHPSGPGAPAPDLPPLPHAGGTRVDWGILRWPAGEFHCGNCDRVRCPLKEEPGGRGQEAVCFLPAPVV